MITTIEKTNAYFLEANILWIRRNERQGTEFIDILYNIKYYQYSIIYLSYDNIPTACPTGFLWGLVCDKDSLPFLSFFWAVLRLPFSLVLKIKKYQDDNVNVSQYNIYYFTSEIMPFDNIEHQRIDDVSIDRI